MRPPWSRPRRPRLSPSGGGVNQGERLFGRLPVALAVLLVMIGSTACASTANGTETSGARPENRDVSRRTGHSLHLGSSAPTGSTPVPEAPLEATLGEPLALGAGFGRRLLVTVQAVVDPAQGGDPLSLAQVGYRFVGVEVVVRPTGGVVRTDVSADTEVVGSDGRTYFHDDDPLVGCTAVPMGTAVIGVGSTVSGCVTFEVPDAVSLAAVQFTLGHGQAQGRWRVS